MVFDRITKLSQKERCKEKEELIELIKNICPEKINNYCIVGCYSSMPDTVIWKNIDKNIICKQITKEYGLYKICSFDFNNGHVEIDLDYKLIIIKKLNLESLIIPSKWNVCMTFCKIKFLLIDSKFMSDLLLYKNFFKKCNYKKKFIIKHDKRVENCRIKIIYLKN